MGQRLLLGRKQRQSDALPHFGRSLWVTGFVVASPHLIARTNAEDTMPAMLLTVFGFIARGALVLRVWPPDFSSRAHSRLRCSGVISVMFIASSSGARYARHLVSLNGFGRQVLLCVLLHELCQEHRQRRRHRRGDAAGAGLAHLLLGAARCLGGHRLLLRCEPGFAEKLLLLTGGSQGELVAPYHLP